MLCKRVGNFRFFLGWKMFRNFKRHRLVALKVGTAVVLSINTPSQTYEAVIFKCNDTD